MASRERLRLADQIFAAALDLDHADRAAYLDRACSDDRQLRALVDDLLAASDTGTGPLFPEGGVFGDLWGGLEPEPTLTGTHIDRYRIVREIGRGGMAEVYLAERDDGQFEQQVALKLIKRGTDTDEVVRRFGQERQILAAAHHPNIARLVDGGATAEGRPYFVMEYVAGAPIDRYCDEHQLAIRDRLEIFLQAARAVDYAHRNLIVHRDIKPSNILVTPESEVKLLDFGIAKLLDADDEPSLTRTHSRIMTPTYASPEQVVGAAVTTASDVYQLGLLLYLLLTGQLPYDTTPASGDLTEAITTRPPQRPSTVVSGARSSAKVSERVVEISRQRRTTPSRLRRELAGDLDNLLLKALRKEPERRYASVAQLIDDVERHLADRPILARPDRLSYRLSKFVQRHAAAVAAAAAALMLIIGLVVFYTLRLAHERDRANQEAERAARAAVAAEEVSDFLVELFEISDPTAARGETVTARELLDRGAEKVTRELDDQPLTQARLMLTIGKVYANLGLFEAAAALLETSLERQLEQVGDSQRGVVEARYELAVVYRQMGRFAEAEALYRAVIPHLDRVYGDDPRDLATIFNGLALLYRDLGRFADAEPHYLRALRIFEEHIDPDDIELAIMRNNLALFYRDQERLDAAEPLFELALPALEKSLGVRHPHVAVILNNLALLYRDRDKLNEAEPLFRRAGGIFEETLGPDHPNMAMLLHNLGDLLSDLDQGEEAEQLYLRSRSILEAAIGPDHPNVANSLHSLADLYRDRGDLEDAEPLYRRALEIREASLDPQHPRLVQLRVDLAEVLRQLGKVEEAAVVAGE